MSSCLNTVKVSKGQFHQFRQSCNTSALPPWYYSHISPIKCKSILLCWQKLNDLLASCNMFLYFSTDLLQTSLLSGLLWAETPEILNPWSNDSQFYGKKQKNKHVAMLFLINCFYMKQISNMGWLHKRQNNKLLYNEIYFYTFLTGTTSF